MKIPKTHPRYKSLLQREKLIEGVENGVTATAGLIAQGRGEAFDYLIGERTTENARKAIRAAVAKLLLAKHPVLSINGNVAMLAPDDYIKLGEVLDAPIEINLFYKTPERVDAIKALLHEHGCKNLLFGDNTRIPTESARGFVDSRGQGIADVVLVPLEDGDRTEALKKAGKFVIAIDLNPLSRTARKADITIVDNIVRALPLMIKYAEGYKSRGVPNIEFNNRENLMGAIALIKERLADETILD
ncbi:MAG: phosphopantothenate/pantothenate synthetase [Candidatus Diapherotrites archaeon]|nr:phosphopantothenate/pantothenate synthetase [Candidatus Diapherotrites archaeon]